MYWRRYYEVRMLLLNNKLLKKIDSFGFFNGEKNDTSMLTRKIFTERPVNALSLGFKIMKAPWRRNGFQFTKDRCYK
jgi:hypothetical protein